MTSLIFLATVVTGFVGPLATKVLLSRGMEFNHLLFWRSLIAVILVLPFVLRRRAELPAIFSKISGVRMFVGGSVLSLTIVAYAQLTATEVNLIARFDLPIFLVLFSDGIKRFAALALVVLGVLYSSQMLGSGNLLGICAIWAATGLTAFSYWLIRRSALTKSLGALVLPPYIGAIGIAAFVARGFPPLPELSQMPLVLVSSLSAILLYLFCAALFRRARLGAAELTGCIALLCTYFIEGAVVGEAPSGAVGMAAFISVFFGLILVYWEEIPKWLKTKVLVR